MGAIVFFFTGILNSAIFSFSICGQFTNQCAVLEAALGIAFEWLFDCLHEASFSVQMNAGM